MLSQCLLNKISASELRRKLIKSALLVGYSRTRICWRKNASLTVPSLKKKTNIPILDVPTYPSTRQGIGMFVKKMGGFFLGGGESE